MLQAVLVFDSKINVHRIQELISARVIPLYPRLTYKICPLPFTAGSVHCWLPDDDYDINRHVFAESVNLSHDQLQVSVLTSARLLPPDFTGDILGWPGYSKSELELNFQFFWNLFTLVVASLTSDLVF